MAFSRAAAPVYAAAEPSPDRGAREPDALLNEPDDNPEDLAALDAAWEEEEVTFSPAAAGACGRDGLIAKARAVQRPAPGVPASKPQRPIVTYSQRPRA